MSEEIKYRGYTIKAIQEDIAEDPRSMSENLGTMVCSHSRYLLGDNGHGFHTIKEFKEYLNRLQKPVEHKKSQELVSLPLYLYDHSGITMNTTGFSCPWDSFQVGVIYVTREKLQKEYGWKNLTSKRIKQIKEYLKAEVDVYDSFIRGDVYFYKVINPKGKEIDSCCGYYGSDHEKSGLLPSAKEIVDEDINRKLKHEGIQEALSL